MNLECVFRSRAGAKSAFGFAPRLLLFFEAADEDSELIQRHTLENAEEAFAALVRRHVDLVFSSVLRPANGQRQLSEDDATRIRGVGASGAFTPATSH